MKGVDHLDLVVTDPERSSPSTASSSSRSANACAEIEGERGERVVYIGGTSGAGIKLEILHRPG